MFLNRALVLAVSSLSFIHEGCQEPVPTCPVGLYFPQKGTSCVQSGPDGSEEYKCGSIWAGSLDVGETGYECQQNCDSSVPLKYCKSCIQSNMVFANGCYAKGGSWQCESASIEQVAGTAINFACSGVVCGKPGKVTYQTVGPYILQSNSDLKDCKSCEIKQIQSNLCSEKKGTPAKGLSTTILNMFDCNNPTVGVTGGSCTCKAIVCDNTIVDGSIHDCSCIDTAHTGPGYYPR